MEGQQYREVIRKAIIANHPEVEIIDPFSLNPNSIDYDGLKASRVLFKMAEEASNSDVIIACLPEASMGTALEMVRGYDKHKTIISITPMVDNL